MLGTYNARSQLDYQDSFPVLLTGHPAEWYFGGGFALNSTDPDTPYQQGLVLAQYTSGPDAGKFINWDSEGSNGQENAVGILVGWNLANVTNIEDYQNGLVLFLTQGQLLYDPIFVTTGDDKDDALAQLGMRNAIVRPGGPPQIRIYGSESPPLSLSDPAQVQMVNKALKDYKGSHPILCNYNGGISEMEVKRKLYKQGQQQAKKR